MTAQLGWRLASSEVVEIDYPSGNDAALARLAGALPQAPCWLVAVPAPFTAFSAFTQFIARIGAGHEGIVLVIALDEYGKPKAPDAEWTRYWSDFLRAEKPGCATLSYTPRHGPSELPVIAILGDVNHGKSSVVVLPRSRRMIPVGIGAFPTAHAR